MHNKQARISFSRLFVFSVILIFSLVVLLALGLVVLAGADFSGLFGAARTFVHNPTTQFVLGSVVLLLAGIVVNGKN